MCVGRRWEEHDPQTGGLLEISVNRLSSGKGEDMSAAASTDLLYCAEEGGALLIIEDRRTSPTGLAPLLPVNPD